MFICASCNRGEHSPADFRKKDWALTMSRYNVRNIDTNEVTSNLRVSDLKEMAKDGRLRANDRIRKEGHTTWHLASVVDGLDFLEVTTTSNISLNEPTTEPLEEFSLVEEKPQDSNETGGEHIGEETPEVIVSTPDLEVSECVMNTSERKANKMGIYVSRVEPATEPQSTSDVNTSPTLNPTTMRDELRKTVHSGCHVCAGEDLINQKVYRLSGPAVVIGYILLIPSFIGIALNVIFLIVIGAGATGPAISSSAMQEAMMNNDPTLDPAIAEEAANTFAGCTCCLGGLLGIGPVVGMILCFVGGLLGWILIMKKKVMVCRNCKTIVSNVV
jgi:hypothetical protein